ncbi:chromatin accessibility complex protein 1 [Nematostella vectensis]|uniref:chromatin accessibility complex protein 1 n=1 Tax=Nematostella vectensis TaxID=45351 RepID=UPI0020773129|nr:chromatin accessibility complex protein 1 [Nematostella vectensis]
MADEHGSPESGKLTQLPLSKIKTIMKSSPDLANISQESLFLIARSTEVFVNYLAVAALKKEESKKHLSYKALAQLVEDEDALQFLSDIIPPKMLVKDYFEMMKKKESRTEQVEISDSDSD